MASADYTRLKESGKHSQYELGGLVAFLLFVMLEDLNVCKFPAANPEDLDEYAWRIHERKRKEVPQKDPNQ